MLRTVTRRRRPWWLILGPTGVFIALVVVVLGVAVVGIVTSLGAHATGVGGGRQSVGCGGGQPVPVNGSAPGLTPEQLGNARAIAGVALGLGLGRPGVLVGITTALAESSLINVGHGDAMGPSSIGLFQQMPSWGPLAVRTDPAGSAGLFYAALLKLSPSWTTMSIPAAAQAVEQSEFDGRTFWPGRGILPLGQNYANQLSQAEAITTGLLAGQPVAGPTAPPVVVPLPVAPVGGSCDPGLTPGAVYTPPGLEQNDSQNPASFGWVHGGPMEPLVYQGHNFGQVAKGTAKLWTALLNALVPSIPGGLNSDLGCFEDRRNVNNPTVLSFHAYGLACDLNSGVNCNGCTAQSLQGRQFALPMATHDVVAKYCAQWGGDFRGTPDPMHIEIHCTPQQIAAWSATQP